MGAKYRNAAFPREYKKFALKHAHKPQDSKYMAGVVQVSDSHGKGFAYIKFSDDLVVAIGKALPYGLGVGQEGYLKIVHARSSKVWRIFAYYIGSSVGVLLWETPDKPEWLKKIRRAENGGKSTQAKTATAS